MSEDKTTSNPLDERVWEDGWEGHQHRQLLRMASLTLNQKLEWLEQAQGIVDQLQQSARRGDDANPKQDGK